MKVASILASLVLVTSLAQAKDRYVVVFKSDVGFKSMESFLTRSESAKSYYQKSLRKLQSVVIKTQNTVLLNSLKNHPEVLAIEPEIFHALPKPVNGFSISKLAKLRIKIPGFGPKPQLPQDQIGQIGEDPNSPDLGSAPIFTAGESTPWGILAVHAGDAWALSGAGSRARVAVLDTGIDAKHPAISGNFEKGRNFTEDKDGKVDPAAFQDEEGHGTHCSGTVLGTYNEKTGFTGVAPKAKLLMGKVCSSQGCSSVAVADAINWAIEEKVDVISMSLGGPIGSSIERKAVESADAAGVVVVAASGNGADAPKYSPNKNSMDCRFSFPNTCGVSFPAAFPSVVAVGALSADLKKTSFSQWGPELDITAPGGAVISSVPMGTGRESKIEITVNGETRKIKSAAFGGTELFVNPVINSIVAVPGVGKPEDFAKVNVAGKFALVSRGEIKFVDKVNNAIAAKAAGVIIYNNVDGLMQGALTEDGSLINMPVVMIEKVEGTALAESTKSTDVVASVTTSPSDYASFDGTSMATPHVAGVVALIKSANKTLTPSQVRAILKATAKALSPNDTNQYGAGIVQADAAVKRALGQ